MLAELRNDKNECRHTLGISAGRVRAGLCGSAAGTGGGGRGVGCSCTAAVAAPEVRAVAGLLTIGVLLSISWGAIALWAGSNTVVGVICLVIAGAGHMVALGCAADILGFTYS